MISKRPHLFMLVSQLAGPSDAGFIDLRLPWVGLELPSRFCGAVRW